jgi:hypothetical protein
MFMFRLEDLGKSKTPTRDYGEHVINSENEAEKERARQLDIFRMEVGKLAEDPTNFMLHGIHLEQLTQEDLVFFNRFKNRTLTLEDIERQKEVMPNLSQVNKAKQILEFIEHGDIPKLLDTEELKLFSKIKAGRLNRAEIEDREQALLKNMETVSASLQLLDFMEDAIKSEYYQERSSG